MAGETSSVCCAVSHTDLLQYKGWAKAETKPGPTKNHNHFFRLLLSSHDVLQCIDNRTVDSQHHPTTCACLPSKWCCNRNLTPPGIYEWEMANVQRIARKYSELLNVVKCGLLNRSGLFHTTAADFVTRSWISSSDCVGSKSLNSCWLFTQGWHPSEVTNHVMSCHQDSVCINSLCDFNRLPKNHGKYLLWHRLCQIWVWLYRKRREFVAWEYQLLHQIYWFLPNTSTLLLLRFKFWRTYSCWGESVVSNSCISHQSSLTTKISQGKPKQSRITAHDCSLFFLHKSWYLFAETLSMSTKHKKTICFWVRFESSGAGNKESEAERSWFRLAAVSLISTVSYPLLPGFPWFTLPPTTFQLQPSNTTHSW